MPVQLCKIIRAFEIIRVNKFSVFYEINIYQVMIFRLYTVYTNHEMTKISNQTREKLQVLSQVLE